jgi:hypothetical protein
MPRHLDTHTIRLRGPWECGLAPADGDLKSAKFTRIHMPAAILSIVPRGFAGLLRCQRHFGCPTCLDAHEAVLLVVDGCRLSGSVSLNREPLGQVEGQQTAAAEFDITHRLKDRNELMLELAVPRGQTGGGADEAALLFDDVRLEIRG